SNNNTASDVGAANERVLVSPASPAINTVPDVTTVTLGTASVTLHDTAQLTGGYHPTGTITFTLVYNNAVVDTETVPVSGNGSYTTPAGYTLPITAAMTGTSQRNAVSTAAINTDAATDIGAATLPLHDALPISAINTVPDVTSVTLGTTTVTLHDTAQLSGGYHPTGTITFTLV